MKHLQGSRCKLNVIVVFLEHAVVCISLDGFRIRIHFMRIRVRIRIQGLKNLPMRIRIQGVKNLRIQIQVSIYTKKLGFIYVKKAKRNFGSASKCGSGSRDSRKCGSGSRDSKNADPLRIRIRNPALDYSSGHRE